MTMKAQTSLVMYTVYYDTKDFPGRYVVRRWRVEGAKPMPDREALCVVDGLQEARQRIPPNLTCLPRFDQDDPCIVEVWM